MNFQAPSNLMAGDQIHLPRVEGCPFFYLNLGDPELFDRLILHPQYGEQSDDVGLELVVDHRRNLVLGSLMFECYAGSACDVGIELLATMKPTPEAVGLLLHQWEQSWGKAA